MREDLRGEVEALIAPELIDDEQICVVVARTGATGLFVGPGSDVAVVATSVRLFFIERSMTGHLDLRSIVAIADSRVDNGFMGQVAFMLLTHLRLELPEGPVTVGNARCRRDIKALRSLIASTNA